MTITVATNADRLSVIRSLQRKQADYMTTAHAKDDIANGRMIVAKNNQGKIVGFISLEEKPTYKYTALRRGIVPNKKNRGKGIMDALIQYAIARPNKYPLGATPWSDNIAIRKILERNGFTHQYTFNECWMFYRRP